MNESGLDAVELNMSYYRFPFPNMVKSWTKTGRSLAGVIKVHRKDMCHPFTTRACTGLTFSNAHPSTIWYLITKADRNIWTGVRHPETMGKISAFQKSLKRFLSYVLRNSTNIRDINR
ncbi:MAG: hypothetical protein KAU14_06935 [Thermoplasmata archaeon]|nr:hypothetical protein [Thermoplasmata archaeon]